MSRVVTTTVALGGARRKSVALSGSSAAVPLVAAIAPVAAVARRHEDDTGKILRVLVAELYRGVQACGRSVSGAEIATVHRIRYQRLVMHGAVHVPTLMIVGVERLEVHVLRVVRDTGGARQLADAHADPLGAGRPSFDAVMVDRKSVG